ncbi:MAG: hypothetical protein K940chlam6_00894 [Chlamydiae bacterium]|nr:hypothetical protein [Chlamydiota bacterium]
MMKMESWQQRYPDIRFFLSFFPYEKAELIHDSKPLEEWLENLRLAEIEVLYISGLINFALPIDLHNWLAERKERTLVFVEKDLGAFAAFKEEKLLQNPQIHFHYAQEDPIDVLAEMFPTDRLAIFEGKPFDGALLKRKSASLSALYSDVLYSHKIVENVTTNFQRLKGCFDARGKFEGVPAVICGAGPSLSKAIPALQNAKEKALIFAGGSAITALTQLGLQPHFAMALDPNDEEFDRLKQAHFFEGPFLFAPRLHRHVFCTSNGPFGYLKSDTGGFIENFLEKELEISGDPIGPDLGPEAFSVTTLALAYAFAMGCNPILFAGVDLAYTGGERYARGVKAEKMRAQDPSALEERIMRKDIHGKDVETLLKWVMEAECISTFAKKHPEVQFFNCTGGGIGFAEVKNTALDEALANFSSQDFEGRIHQWIQSSPLHFREEKLFQIFENLESSLERCETLCLEIIRLLEKESGKLVLHQSDFVDEMAYSWLLEGIDIALSRILFRYYPHLDPNEGKRQREMAKYHELKRQISKFKNIFNKRKAYA